MRGIHREGYERAFLFLHRALPACAFELVWTESIESIIKS